MNARRLLVIAVAALLAGVAPAAPGADMQKVLHVAFVAPENGFDPQSWRNLSDPFPPWHYPDHTNHASVPLR